MIYLDHNASNLPDPRLLERMIEVLRAAPGNAGSPHAAGRRARRWIEQAREQLAEVLGFPVGQVTFCASGTEAINLALTGLTAPGDHVLSSAIEHKAVHACLDLLAEQGRIVHERIPVDSTGRVLIPALQDRLRPETRLVAIMAANNEVGTIQDLAAIRAALPEGVRLFSDGVQAVGRLALDWSSVDAMTVSGHKLRAPKGAAALLTRKGLDPRPLLVGGSQERSRRAGTEDTAAIAALGEAVRLAGKGELFDRGLLRERRDRFEAALLDAAPGLEITAREAERLPQTVHVILPSMSSEEMITRLDLEGIAVSAGSACSSGSLLPSHVLTAMGLSEDCARRALRLSFGPETSADELARAAAALGSAL